MRSEMEEMMKKEKQRQNALHSSTPTVPSESKEYARVSMIEIPDVFEEQYAGQCGTCLNCDVSYQDCMNSFCRERQMLTTWWQSCENYKSSKGEVN
jgi:hypothetical protein